MTMRPFPVSIEHLALVIGFRNPSLIADTILPYETVTSEMFKYVKLRLADSFTLPDTKVGRKSTPNKVDFAASETTDSVESFGLSDFVPQSDIEATVSNYDPLQRSLLGIMDLILLDREKRVCDLVTNPANYSKNKTVLANSEKFKATGGNAYGVISDALTAMLVKPNNLVFGAKLWNYLSKDPSLVTAVYGKALEGKKLKRTELAELFEVDTISIGQSFVNSAAKGKTPELVQCWGDDMLFFHKNTNANIQSGGTFGFTARWKDRIAETEYKKEVGLTGGYEVWAGEKVKEVIASEAHGYLIKNCI